MCLLLERLVSLDPDSDDNLSIKNKKKQTGIVTTGNESKWTRNCMKSQGRRVFLERLGKILMRGA